ncbi:UrcA family protein [Alteriqipengyuania lutimaris]|uniref:UrcA family protein n=1 Tax=Alteriqipengyuania lutimaris TaxID=1538146 RepID=A0A395LR06_9SPHN|nr:UrcA family protein [Alteriqipengyuania lutimaris]MBB3032934.1 UrcA family protein [Alteriqipengyuania lutimaris]RDS77984.1 UrcA family protein [Alteriqipengyuania lutimaris]
MNTRNVILAAALAAIALPTAAVAADRSVDISVADLDLSQAADRAVLDTRIDRAVRKVCATGTRGVTAQHIEAECRAQVAGKAAQQAELAIADARETRLATIALDPEA